MFDKKLQNFEVTFKNAIAEDIDIIVKPVRDEVVSLKKENKDLKAQMSAMKIQSKNSDERIEVLENTITQQQKYLVKTDKDIRLKKLLVAGLQEDTNLVIGEYTATNDTEKIKLIMKTINLDESLPISWRRLGSKDLGTQERPRYLQVEFNTFNTK